MNRELESDERLRTAGDEDRMCGWGSHLETWPIAAATPSDGTGHGRQRTARGRGQLARYTHNMNRDGTGRGSTRICGRRAAQEREEKNGDDRIEDRRSEDEGSKGARDQVMEQGEKSHYTLGMSGEQ